jgi:hypothetical protein
MSHNFSNIMINNNIANEAHYKLLLLSHNFSNGMINSTSRNEVH